MGSRGDPRVTAAGTAPAGGAEDGGDTTDDDDGGGVLLRVPVPQAPRPVTGAVVVVGGPLLAEERVSQVSPEL